jgi:hypothetical protein
MTHTRSRRKRRASVPPNTKKNARSRTPKRGKAKSVASASVPAAPSKNGVGDSPTVMEMTGEGRGVFAGKKLGPYCDYPA